MAFVNADRTKAYMRRWCERNRVSLKADAHRRYERDRERRIAYQKEYSVLHPEIALTYRARNRERLTAQRLAWRKKNLDKDKATRARYEVSGKRPKTDLTAWHRAWYERNREKVLAASRRWAKENPEKARAKRALRRARLAGVVIIPFTHKELEAHLAKFGGRCWMCGMSATELDHVKPVVLGGAHTLDNLRPACLPCNRRKGAREWPSMTQIA